MIKACRSLICLMSWGPKPNSEVLMKVLDEINNKGRSKIWFTGQGIVKGWQMK
ncbi:DUF4113 domain-containing protein [Hafnia alvei]|uniref:DUF4113 domain-containing protein n=1 Tax=Hafnia alvei TaxID=569 RepID=UPI002867F95A|nr:DUF4113 domain-containing protein [Hafnia alvei]